MNTREIIYIVAIIFLITFSYYLYSSLATCRTLTEDFGSRLQECGSQLEQLQKGIQDCMLQATQCKENLNDLQETCGL